MKIYDFTNKNSLLAQFVRELRDVTIQNDRMRFRRNIERIGEILSYEISKTLNYNAEEITTPLDNITVNQCSDNIVLGTIFRAGIAFHHGFLNYFDKAENAFVSAFRKYKDTLKFDVHIEYIATPNLDDKVLILVDPMLATGVSMELSMNALLTKGKGKPKHIHLVSIIASQEAIRYLEERIKDTNVSLWVAVVDPEINEHSYIVPGLGDAGDLAYGEKM